MTETTKKIPVCSCLPDKTEKEEKGIQKTCSVVMLRLRERDHLGKNMLKMEPPWMPGTKTGAGKDGKANSWSRIHRQGCTLRGT